MSSRRSRTLTDYYSAALRRKLLVVAPALVLAASVGGALWNLPKLYKSTAIISVANSSAEGTPGDQLNILREQVTGPPVVEAVLARIPSLQEPLAAATAKIRKRVSIESEPPTSFAIAFRAEDPEIARSVTETIAARLAAHNADAQPAADPTLDALRKRAAEISTRLREIEEREPRLTVGAESPPVQTVQANRPAQPSAEFIRAQQMTIEGLKDQHYKFQQELAEVERRIAEQRKIVDQQSKGSNLRDNPTYAVLITKRTELQGQRDTLINRQELTDKHPRVLAIDDQIAAINRQIEELRRQDVAVASQSPEARELASLSSERNRLKIELEVTERELTRRSSNQPAAPTSDPQPVRREIGSASLAREYSSLKRDEKDVANQIQELEAKALHSSQPIADKFKLLESASLPTSPTSPDSVLVISIALILGLALGICFVAIAESSRFNSLQDARDVEHYTRLPLLGSIPKTTTAAERRSIRWRANARIFLGASVSIAITVALARVFIAADILSLITKK